MNKTEFRTKIKRFYQHISGSTTEYDHTAYENILSKIKKIEKKLKTMTDQHLQQISDNLKLIVQRGFQTENQTIQAFALTAEVARRILNMHPFDVQLLGALAMNQGKLVEMQTGEGKTLTAIFPAYLHALSGKGVHILTSNDYLADRDSRWMEPVYEFLGLQVGCIQEGMGIAERQNAYNADMTYLTAKEAGFDYLRDSLCYHKDQVVHRPFHFAIIDEADSILIDEARIPLVIAGTVDEEIANTIRMAEIVQQLEAGIDFNFDEYMRNIHLTARGEKQLERLLKCENIYAPQQYELLTRLYCAIHAEFFLKRDVDYIVRSGKIEIVDEFTGRVAERRRWPDGLQAAIEAKEKINIRSGGNILNSITLQHFLQLYPNKCAMTATAQTAEREFREFYNLHIVVIPPNKPCIRQDNRDVIFNTKAAKTKALIDHIVLVHQSRRPILVGTRSVDESACLADALKNRHVQCRVLNAKNDNREARIIAQAGEPGAVTISTNMAGRGTDIRLGGSNEKDKEEVLNLGGLYVIGTNKHESTRIDLQLRGRAGRQGDPGCSRFFISLEDDLFIKYRLRDLLSEKYIPRGGNSGGEIGSQIIEKEINRVQRIIEGQNLEIKKTLNKYSTLIEKQRTVLFNRRSDIIKNGAATEFFHTNSAKKYYQFQKSIDHDKLEKACQYISCYFIDQYWSEYLAKIEQIRESIHLKRIGGQDPYIEFQKLAITTFDSLLEKLDDQLIRAFNKIKKSGNEFDLHSLDLKAPSATWTYFINDNPFENTLGVQLIGNIGVQVTAGLLGPMMSLSLWLRRSKRTIEQV